MQAVPKFTPYRWEKLGSAIPDNSVSAGETYVVVRAHHNNDWIVGKLNTNDMNVYVPYDDKEVNVQGQVEVLVHAPGALVHWKPASKGQIPQNAIGPVGKEELFVGRAICPQPESQYTPGKVHPGNKCLYMPWGGKEVKFEDYEVCVIEEAPLFQWQKFAGHLPSSAVVASDTYAVVRANFNGNLIPGKLHTSTLVAYIPYDSKEVEVKDNLEVLVHAPEAEVAWVPASQGHVPENAIGPIGKDGLYVGRAQCPAPESKLTPGKVHPDEKGLYIPWDGKEQKVDNYEVLVIKKAHPYRWEKFAGKIPPNAVHAGQEYVVIKANHGGDWVPGKLSVNSLSAYVPYDSKEVEVQGSEVEVLVHAPRAEVHWVSALNGEVPAETVGPIGNEGVYIGRVVCPAPESKHTPGKIHPGHKCLYLPWDGKEITSENYEACVVTYLTGQHLHDFHHNTR